MNDRVCEIVINAPVDVVFGCVEDPENFNALMPGVTFGDVVRTPGGVGTTYRFRTRVAGVTIRGAGQFVEFERNRLIRDETTVATEGSFSWRFEPLASGTRLTLEHHAGKFWGVPLLGRILADSYQRSDEDVLRRIKTACEQQASEAHRTASTG